MGGSSKSRFPAWRFARCNWCQALPGGAWGLHAKQAGGRVEENQSMCPNWEEGGRGQFSMGRASFAPAASLHSLQSLAGAVADGPAPAHPISAHCLPAGSSQYSTPPAPSWPVAGCQARGCLVASAGKPMAGSVRRAQQPCSGSGLHSLLSSGETPPTPVWGLGNHGDLQPGCPTTLCPPCRPAQYEHTGIPGHCRLLNQSSSPPPRSLHFANKLWHSDTVAGFGE